MLQTFEAEDYDSLRIKAIIVSVILNIITGFGIEIDVEYGSELVRYHYTSTFIWVVVKLLTFLQLFLSFYYIRSWYKVRSPLAFKKELRNKGDSNDDDDKPPTEEKETFLTKLRARAAPLVKSYEIVRCIYRHES